MIRSSSPGRDRRGLVSVAMLIGLIILGIVAGSLFRLARQRRSLDQLVEKQLQAELLADSGLDRALARLATRPDYPGETWEIPPEELEGRARGRVEIQIRPIAGRPESHRISVTADYFVGHPARVRQSRTLDIPKLPARGSRP